MFVRMRCAPLTSYNPQKKQTTILISIWILQSVYQLFKHVREGTVRMHPMFNFDNEHNRRLLQDSPNSSV